MESLVMTPHYLPVGNIRPRFVLDLGCWIGYTTSLFARKWPRAEIVGVEADPTNAELAVENCAAYENVTIVNATVGEPGERELGGFTRNGRSLFRGESPYPVEVISVDQILRRFKPEKIDFCKMDIEGAELEVLEGPWIKKVTKLRIDTHFGNTDEVLGKLQKLGFKIVDGGVSLGALDGTWYAVRS